MSKTINDKRAIRTKRLIRNALSELIEEKGFSGISITDLTTRAEINRGTFYLHYIDKYDLLEKTENEILQEFLKRIKTVAAMDIAEINSIEKPLTFMVHVFEYIKDNSTFMKAILGPKGDPTFQDKLKDLIKTTLIAEIGNEFFNPEKMLVPKEYFISYVLSAHLGVIQQWLQSDMKKSPEEMASILAKMFFFGPFRVRAGVAKI